MYNGDNCNKLSLVLFNEELISLSCHFMLLKKESECLVIKKQLKNFISSVKRSLMGIAVATTDVSTTELVNVCFNFVELYSGRKLYPYQEQFSKRVIRSILVNDGEEITALFARQSGKSETISDTTGGLMILLPILASMPMFQSDKRFKQFKDGLWVGIFAPSQRQAQITYSRIKSRLQSPTAVAILEDPEFNLQFTTSNGQTCALSNGSFATAISASDGSSIEGESFKLIICEECQDISNFKITKSIHPMGAAYNATIVKIGTSTTFKGNFYEAIQRNKKLYEDKKIRIRNHFEYDYTVASKYNPNYARYVESEKRRLGEKSDEFRMSYGLEWILTRGMFVDVSTFEKNNVEPLMSCVPYDKEATHCVGIDLGGKGDDTVITVVEVNWDMPVIMEDRVDPDTQETISYLAYNSYIKYWYEISNEPDYEVQYHEIMDVLSHFKIAKVYCDATREASIAHRLRANLKCEVVPYVFSSKSKSELYKNLETEITSGRAIVPGSSEVVETKFYKKFIYQLGELQKDYRGSNLVVHHPDEKDAHDDYPDSWALAVLATRDKGEVNETESRDKKYSLMGATNNEREFYKTRNSFTAKRR